MNIKPTILLTGGTIDKEYNVATSNLDFSCLHIPKILNEARVNHDYNIETMFRLKDSVDMDIHDREEMLSKIKYNDRTLIVHGTSTMIETAKYLQKHMNLTENRVVVLTGAFIPYIIKNSDAMFNIGFALGVLKYLTKGIYIAMNGEVFDIAEGVEKNNNQFRRIYNG